MINTTDIRRGNLFIDNLKKRILVVDEITADSILFDFLNAPFTALPDGWQAEPIPLTPEVLVKCGFVKLKLDNGFYYEKYLNNKETLLFSDNILSYGILGASQYEWSACDHIQSLHQLMNLYHALTGEELNYIP